MHNSFLLNVIINQKCFQPLFYSTIYQNTDSYFVSNLFRHCLHIETLYFFVLSYFASIIKRDRGLYIRYRIVLPICTPEYSVYFVCFLIYVRRTCIYAKRFSAKEKYNKLISILCLYVLRFWFNNSLSQKSIFHFLCGRFEVGF